MAIVHKGLKEFTGDEVSNLFLGQAGFHIVRSASGQTRVCAAETDVGTTTIDEGGGSETHTNKDAKYWCAIKAVGGACTVSARSLLPGDDFNLTGDYASAGDIILADGDIIYGAFDAITVTGSNQDVMALIGR